MKKKIAVALGLILIIAVVVGAAIKTNSESTVDVKTAEAKLMEYEDKVLATGSVEVVDSVDLVASLPGKLTLKVQEGDRVEKGQVLAELDVSEQQQQLKDAESALQKAEDGLQKSQANLANAQKANEETAAAAKNVGAKLAEATQQLEAVTALWGEGKATQGQLDEAKQAYAAAEKAQKTVSTIDPSDLASFALQVEQAEAQVDTIRSTVKTARSAVEKGTLTAPLNGVVLQVAAKNGSYVQPGITLITVGDLDQLQVVAKLSEQDIEGIEAGQEVEVRWAGAPEQVVKGEVTRIAPAVSTPELGQTETFIKVYITIEKGETNLKPGATVDVVIYRVKPRQSLLIPNEALAGEGENQHVFVVEKGTAKKYKVKTGYSNELFTEIQQGIKEQAQVILEPQDIEDGVKVSITGGEVK